MARSIAKIELEAKAKRNALLIGTCGGAAITLIKITGFVLIAFAIRDSIATLAGKQTNAAFSFQAFASYIGTQTSIAEWAEYAVIVGLLIWGSLERKLRKDTIQRLHGRIQSLEKAVDPGRSSSRLTSRGDTREGDKP
jgi:hypothetical protein